MQVPVMSITPSGKDNSLISQEANSVRLLFICERLAVPVNNFLFSRKIDMEISTEDSSGAGGTKRQGPSEAQPSKIFACGR